MSNYHISCIDRKLLFPVVSCSTTTTPDILPLLCEYFIENNRDNSRYIIIHQNNDIKYVYYSSKEKIFKITLENGKKTQEIYNNPNTITHEDFFNNNVQKKKKIETIHSSQNKKDEILDNTPVSENKKIVEINPYFPYNDNDKPDLVLNPRYEPVEEKKEIEVCGLSEKDIDDECDFYMKCYKENIVRQEELRKRLGIDEKENERKRVLHLHDVKEKIIGLMGKYQTYKRIVQHFGKDNIPMIIVHEGEFFNGMSDEDIQKIDKFDDITLMNYERVEDIDDFIYDKSLELEKVMEKYPKKRFDHGFDGVETDSWSVNKSR